MNTNIAMQDVSPQFDSPVNALAKVLQIRDAQHGQQMNAMKMDEYKRGVDSQNALRQLLGGMGQDHQANQQKLMQGGYLKEANDYGKTQADLAKTNSETQYKQIETAHKKIELMGQAFGFVKDNPSAESAIQATDYLVQNGIMTQEQAQATKAKIAADPSPETIRTLATQAYQSALATKDQLPKLQTINAGNRQVNQSVNPITGQVMETGSTPILQSADSIASNATQMRGQNMTDARARDLNAITREGAQTQVINDPIRGPILVNKGTGVARNAVGTDGQPLQGEVPAKKQAAAKNLISVLDEADSLIGKATGSYIGAGVDQLGRAFGGATSGDKASARLKVLEGALMMNQPRMEGPQSDKDVALYRQMAGQIGDSTVPASIKKAAMQSIRAMTEKYAGVTPVDIHSQADAILNGGK